MSVQKELRKGLLITFISKYSNILFELLLTMILSRLLTPAEFGVVAVILVFTMFFNLLGEIGIGTAIVQNNDLDNRHVQSIFNYTVIIAFIIAFSFALVSYPIADFYANKDYINIGRILSIVVFFYILNVVPQGLIRKQKLFLKLEGALLVVNIITGLIAVYLAYQGHGYYALVYREFFKAILIFIINFVNSKFKPTTNFGLNGIKLIFSYSAFQFMFNIINYFSRNLTSLLIGKYMGDTNLGFYDRAYRLMLYPAQTLTYVITPVLHPVLAAYEKQPEIIHDNYKNILELLGFIGLPLSVFLYFSAEEVILIMYGDQWIGSIPVFKILALTIWSQMTLASTGAIFQALGKTKLLFISGFISAFLTVVAVVFGLLQDNLLTIAYGILVAFVINFFQGFYILFGIGFKKPFFFFLRYFKLGALSAILVLFFMLGLHLLTIDLNIVSMVIIKTVLLLLAMCVAMYNLKKDYWQFVLKKISNLKH
ncbi:lipopolysaccharide biosynthesis protein [Flavobacterium sp. ASW18X]|uniref:lipopolysaccharide biosynthesis protein n=1 Tax=Flavobacterium sp. ASW18X TaxID=2572595 RepID=UPI0010ADC737|nr:lipopolysaccharide biosynthesis protein [Flavobacterium sp. ASW18X]TKD65094.1 lipopolysaccharide biosynthesis protein [Flavobacterium sp. ASW18X]